MKNYRVSFLKKESTTRISQKKNIYKQFPIIKFTNNKYSQNTKELHKRCNDFEQYHATFSKNKSSNHFQSKIPGTNKKMFKLDIPSKSSESCKLAFQEMNQVYSVKNTNNKKRCIFFTKSELNKYTKAHSKMSFTQGKNIKHQDSHQETNNQAKSNITQPFKRFETKLKKCLSKKIQRLSKNTDSRLESKYKSNQSSFLEPTRSRKLRLKYLQLDSQKNKQSQNNNKTKSFHKICLSMKASSFRVESYTPKNRVFLKNKRLNTLKSISYRKNTSFFNRLNQSKHKDTYPKAYCFQRNKHSNTLLKNIKTIIENSKLKKSLDLSGQMITDQDLLLFLDTLFKTCKSMQTLDLSNNNLTGDALTFIEPYIRGNTQVRSLNLSANQIKGMSSQFVLKVKQIQLNSGCKIII